MSKRRVVITGLGAISPVGNTVQETWDSIAAGKSGIDTITHFDIELVANHIAGEIKNFDPVELLGRKEVRRTDRATQLAVAACREAFADSELVVTDENQWDMGCIVGSGVGGIQSLAETIDDMNNKGHRGVSPLAIPKFLIDSSSGKVSMDLRLRGPNFSVTTACATGNNAIGEAAEIIRRGQANVMIAAATEAAIIPVTVAGFANMKALSSRNDAPQQASRPFDADRDGFVLGEGAGALVLEDLEHALERGATIYGEVLGYGHTSDAYHPTAPMETGEGASQAMKRALRDAGIEAKDVDYINAHGTGTPLNDSAETNAMKRALGEEAYSIPVSSTKSMTGHLLGAAGAIEAIICLKAIETNFVPPTINLDNVDPACDLDYTAHEGKERDINITMSNAFGFGGHNAVVVLGRYSENGKH